MATIRHRFGAWYVRYRDASGKAKEVNAGKDKREAQRFAAEIDIRVRREKQGLIDHDAERRKTIRQTSIDVFVDQWSESLRGKGVTRKFHRDHSNRLRRLLSLLGVKSIEDLSPGRVEIALGKLVGVSAQTRAHHLSRLRPFVRWLLRERHLVSDPTIGVKVHGISSDRRRIRRSLSDTEVRLLLAQTRHDGLVYRGVDAETRAMCYELAIATALRANELRSLTHASFTFGDQPTVRVDAGTAKNRREAVIPLPRKLATRLEAWLAYRPRRILFPLPQDTGAMLQEDLVRAGIDPVDERKRVADFHALRMTAISRLALGGVPVAVAQQIARHSSPVLTLGVYTDAQEGMRAAVESVAFEVGEEAPPQGFHPTGGTPHEAPNPGDDHRQLLAAPGNEAERGGFEPPIRFNPYNGLATGTENAISQGFHPSLVMAGTDSPSVPPSLEVVIDASRRLSSAQWKVLITLLEKLP